MEILAVPTEVCTLHPENTLGKIYLDWMPQPGDYIDLEGKTYRILERRHRYQFRRGKYNLFRVVVYVQPAPENLDRSLIDGRWIIGDANCHYNALSELIRCAVNPNGPCAGCRFWEVR
ncbi:DUF6464 family protein [Pseudanabaena sp. 'Roaring Creek']|uniref:DUF6464 family protein n=1 Tax=Pseudanabaena sp. 'Roaring Creek' TaxID=1681830 RepID=UPI0006D82001|nr:DUF6464 family protein [Pseudanabaena sp. 'Roaring Creek']